MREIRNTEEVTTEKNHIVKGVGILYDALPDESKQKVCEDLLGRKKFYEDACMKIVDSFNQTVEVKGDVGSGIANEKVEK